MTDASAGRQLHALTSLRFVAAGLVVVEHLASLGAWGTPSQGGEGLHDWRYWCGYAGVAFFFVLSGFVLTWSYGTRMRAASPRTTLRFWMARIARIWPLWLVAVGIGMLEEADYLINQTRTALMALFSSLLLLQAWIPVGGPGGVPRRFSAVGWTLSCEAFFYLLFPLAIWLAMRWWGPPRRAARVALWTIVALAAIPLVLGWVYRADENWGFLFITMPLFHLPGFLLGVVAGRIALGRARAGEQAPEPDAPAGPVRRIVVPLALELGVVALAVGTIAMIAHVPASWRTGPLYLLPFALVIYVFARGYGPLARLLSLRPFVALGDASYALYLVHLPMLSFAVDHLNLHHGSPPAYWLVAIACAQLAAFALWIMVEQPWRLKLRVAGNRRIDAFISRTEPAPATAPATADAA